MRPLEEVSAAGMPQVVEITDVDAVLIFNSSIPLACSVVYGKTPAYGQISVDLRYGDGSSDNHALQVDDWFNDGGELADGVFALIDGLDRTTGAAGGFENSNDPAIFAIGVTPDSAKTLIGIDIARTGGTGITSIFGATGRRVIPEPVTVALLGLSVAGLAGYVRRRRLG